MAAVVVLFAAGCGSGSGSVNPSSSVSRPTQAPTIPDATVRPPATDAPSGATDATEAPPAPTEAPTVAVKPDGTFHCHTGRPLAARLGYDPDLVIAGVVLLVVSNRKRPASS